MAIQYGRTLTFNPRIIQIYGVAGIPLPIEIIIRGCISNWVSDDEYQWLRVVGRQYVDSGECGDKVHTMNLFKVDYSVNDGESPPPSAD